MPVKLIFPAAFAALLSTGCVTIDPLDYGPEPTRATYSDPAESGLLGVRPYPNAGDVCQVIGENALTSNFLDDAAILVGCPKHERGAIADRLAQGGQIVGHAKHWTLLSIPQR
jgi:hypothetical protein